MGRILAVDLGSRRVGLALSDPLGMIASPFKTLPYYSDKKLIAELTEIVEQNEVEIVVIGLPLRENGEEGEGCRRSRNFARRLGARGVATVLWDERYSSRQAEASLRESGIRRKRGLPRVDRIAAAIILEDYLNRHSGS